MTQLSSGIPIEVIKISLGVFGALLLLYVALVLFKNRVIGSKGEFLRVVDVVAVTQTSRVALVELAEHELYVMAINNDRVYPIDKVTNEKVIQRVIPSRGRPQELKSAKNHELA